MGDDARIGEVLRAARLAAGMTQGQLAKARGVTFQVVQVRERREPCERRRALVEAADALGSTPASEKSSANGTPSALPSEETLVDDFRRIESDALRQSLAIFGAAASRRAGAGSAAT